MKPIYCLSTLILLLLLVPAAASAQTKICPKCKRAIPVAQYGKHQANCKGVTPPKPTTQRCPQCGQQVPVAQYYSHVANHQEQARRAEQQRQEEARRAEQQRQEEARKAKLDSLAELEQQSLPTLPTDLGYNTPQTKDFTVKGVTFTMVGVQGGRFTMGALPYDKYARSNETPRHEVTLSSFSIGKYEVTQELWQAVMGSNPSYFTGNLKRPVENVSWDDCQEFIRKLNELTGENFRLPTEAEWEYAARGGQKSRGYRFSGSNDVSSVGWYFGNSDITTHPVGQKQPNELGLYDMSGNVLEWCLDWYGTYPSSAQTNPKGPDKASSRVYRGGGYGSYAGNCFPSFRNYDSPDDRGRFLGLRLAR